MNKVSDAAKAAAVMHYTLVNEPDVYDKAVEIFNALGASHGPVDEVLEKFDALRWEHLAHLPDTQWWEELEMLALNIDAAFDHFEFPQKGL